MPNTQSYQWILIHRCLIGKFFQNNLSRQWSCAIEYIDGSPKKNWFRFFLRKKKHLNVHATRADELSVAWTLRLEREEGNLKMTGTTCSCSDQNDHTRPFHRHLRKSLLETSNYQPLEYVRDMVNCSWTIEQLSAAGVRDTQGRVTLRCIFFNRRKVWASQNFYKTKVELTLFTKKNWAWKPYNSGRKTVLQLSGGSMTIPHN